MRYKAIWKLCERYIECVINLMRSYDKVFDNLFKDKITELIFKFLIMSFYLLYEIKMKYSYLKVLKLFLRTI